MTPRAGADTGRGPEAREPLGLSVVWGYLVGICLVAIPVLVVVEDPIAVLANLRIVDELADVGIVRDVDVGTGFIDGVPEVLAHSRRPISWNLLWLASLAVAGAYLARALRQRLVLQRLGVSSSVPGQLTSSLWGRGLNVLFPFGPGDFGTARRLVRAGTAPARAIAGVFRIRVLELSGIAVLLAVALALAGWGGTLVAALTSVLVVVGLTLTIRPMGDPVGTGEPFPRALWKALHGQRVIADVREMAQETSAFVGLVALSAGALTLEIAGLYLLKQSFSTREFHLLADLPLSGLIMAVAVANLARVVPFTPGGAGFYELSMVAVFLAYGQDATAATTVAVLDGLVTNLVALALFVPTLAGRHGAGVLDAWRGFFRLSERRSTGEELAPELLSIS